MESISRAITVVNLSANDVHKTNQHYLEQIKFLSTEVSRLVEKCRQLQEENEKYEFILNHQ